MLPSKTLTTDAWNESKHPRASNGEWGATASAEAASKNVHASSSPTDAEHEGAALAHKHAQSMHEAAADREKEKGNTAAVEVRKIAAEAHGRAVAASNSNKSMPALPKLSVHEVTPIIETLHKLPTD